MGVDFGREEDGDFEEVAGGEGALRTKTVGERGSKGSVDVEVRLRFDATQTYHDHRLVNGKLQRRSELLSSQVNVQATHCSLLGLESNLSLLVRH